MSEGFKEPVLKTGVRKRTVGSNPILSAINIIFRWDAPSIRRNAKNVNFPKGRTFQPKMLE